MIPLLGAPVGSLPDSASSATNIDSVASTRSSTPVLYVCVYVCRCLGQAFYAIERRWPRRAMETERKVKKSDVWRPKEKCVQVPSGTFVSDLCSLYFSHYVPCACQSKKQRKCSFPFLLLFGFLFEMLFCLASLCSSKFVAIIISRLRNDARVLVAQVFYATM